jgi:hypothetical protein
MGGFHPKCDRECFILRGLDECGQLGFEGLFGRVVAEAAAGCRVEPGGDGVELGGS